MAFLSSMNIVASGMTAQQLRLDVVAENVTNSTTTRTEAGGPYRRKMVVFQSVAGRDDFRAAMAELLAAWRRTRRFSRWRRPGYADCGGSPPR